MSQDKLLNASRQHLMDDDGKIAQQQQQQQQQPLRTEASYLNGQFFEEIGSIIVTKLGGDAMN